jgi:hypothetical protein
MTVQPQVFAEKRDTHSQFLEPDKMDLEAPADSEEIAIFPEPEAIFAVENLGTLAMNSFTCS